MVYLASVLFWVALTSNMNFAFAGNILASYLCVSDEVARQPDCRAGKNLIPTSAHRNVLQQWVLRRVLEETTGLH
jgi:hypothetical protein